MGAKPDESDKSIRRHEREGTGVATARWRVIHGGHYGQPVRRAVARAGSYRIEANPWGVAYVYFAWSPTHNVFDCIMRLDEAVMRGLVPAPRTALTLAASNGAQR